MRVKKMIHAWPSLRCPCSHRAETAQNQGGRQPFLCLFPKAAHFLKKKTKQFCPPTLHSASRRSSFHLIDAPDPRMVLSAAPLLVSPTPPPPLQTLPVIQSRHPFIPQIGNGSSANSANHLRIHVGSEGQPWLCADNKSEGVRVGVETQELPE